MWQDVTHFSLGTKKQKTKNHITIHPHNPHTVLPYCATTPEQLLPWRQGPGLRKHRLPRALCAADNARVSRALAATEEVHGASYRPRRPGHRPQCRYRLPETGTPSLTPPSHSPPKFYLTPVLGTHARAPVTTAIPLASSIQREGRLFLKVLERK